MSEREFVCTAKCRVCGESPHSEARRLAADLAAAREEVAKRDRALEWLASAWASERHFEGQRQGPNCPLQPKVDLIDRTSCPWTEDERCEVLTRRITYRECAVRCALAAAEESKP